MGNARKKAIKPLKAWALIDPEYPEILPHRIYEKRTEHGGRGSITENWIAVRVEVCPVRKKRPHV